MPRKTRSFSGRGRPSSRRNYARARGGTSVLMHAYHSSYAKGSGQVNITAASLGLLKMRALRLLNFTITIALSVDSKNTIPGTSVENVLIKVYDPALDNEKGSNVIRTWGPFMISTLPKTFRFRVPYHEPTEMGDEGSNRKIISVYDYGEATQYGLVINLKAWVQYASNVNSGTYSAVEKRPLFEEFSHLSL